MKSSKPAAAAAIALLQAVYDAHGVEAVALLVGPNVILTLAGARPLGDQVFYGNAKQLPGWQAEIETTCKTLAQHLSMYYEVHSEVSADEYSHVSYDMVTLLGLQWALSQTELLTDEQKQSLLAGSLHFDIMQRVGACLQQHEQLRDLNEDDIQHVAAGVMLGYPDIAILDSLHSSEDNPPVNARIHHKDEYPCPWPVYEYDPAHANHPAIVEHETLWNSILDDFYSSSFHAQLRKDPAFLQKIDELGE